jgi:adenylate kinase
MHITAVFGISGVGKSWLIGQLLEKHDLVHVQASVLMREAKAKLLNRSVDSEELRTGKVVDNQAMLIEAFEALRLEENRDIIFDGHNLIDSDQGFVEIPIEVIKALKPSSIVVIVDDPDAIAARRAADTGRVRPARKAAELQNYQDLVIRIARDHAARLQIPFTKIRSGAMEDFEVAVFA